MKERISNYRFMDFSEDLIEQIFLNHKEFDLPLHWDGKDFLEVLKNHLNNYNLVVKNELTYMNYMYYEDSNSKISKREFIDNLQKIIFGLLQAVEDYLNGFPSKAYTHFCPVMTILKKMPIRIYQKSILEILGGYNDKLNLFRVVGVSSNSTYKKMRVFHAPYDKRYKVSASRYSIEGFPSLYLGTSLELCSKEVITDKKYKLASKFMIDRIYDNNHIDIQVIELGIKPQDFFREDNSNRQHKRYFNELNLKSNSVRIAYIIWYPLIAACSYVRANRGEPFAAEYIVPQLLMQWVREEMERYEKYDNHKLIGIRYFSCESDETSEMGFDYVFPSSGKKFSDDYPYCKILMRAFKMTKPYIIYDNSEEECEKVLINDYDLTYVDDEA